MPDNDEWLVNEIMGHCFLGKSIEFNIRWTAGNHTWEPYAHVRDLEALDHYYALMGVTCCGWILTQMSARIHQRIVVPISTDMGAPLSQLSGSVA